MIALAVGLGVLGFFALRRARRGCYAGHDGYDGYGWHGPWAAYEEPGEEEHGHHRRHRGHRGGPPWMRGRRGRRGRWMLHAALTRIDATPAQERAIVGELDRLRARVSGVRDGLRDAHVDLAAAVRGPLLDDAALGAVLGRVDSATSETRAAALDALRNIHAVLDDKQRTALADMIERRGGRGPGGGGSWFRMGPYR